MQDILTNNSYICFSLRGNLNIHDINMHKYVLLFYFFQQLELSKKGDELNIRNSLIYYLIVFFNREIYNIYKNIVIFDSVVAYFFNSIQAWKFLYHTRWKLVNYSIVFYLFLSEALELFFQFHKYKEKSFSS